MPNARKLPRRNLAEFLDVEKEWKSAEHVEDVEEEGREVKIDE